MLMAYFARKQLNVDGRTVQIGEPVPEAAGWSSSWIAAGFVVKVDDDDLARMSSLAEVETYFARLRMNVPESVRKAFEPAPNAALAAGVVSAAPPPLPAKRGPGRPPKAAGIFGARGSSDNEG